MSTATPRLSAAARQLLDTARGRDNGVHIGPLLVRHARALAAHGLVTLTSDPDPTDPRIPRFRMVATDRPERRPDSLLDAVRTYRDLAARARRSRPGGERWSRHHTKMDRVLADIRAVDWNLSSALLLECQTADDITALLLGWHDPGATIEQATADMLDHRARVGEYLDRRP